MANILFRSKILNAAKELTQENVNEIKYLLKSEVGEGVLENIKTSLDLFNALEQLGWISPTSLEFLYGLLKHINRGDIVNTLNQRVAGENVPVISTCKNLKAEETIPRKVLDIVANHITGDWKRLGRCLDLQDSVIEQIDLDAPKSYEKAMQMLRSWTKSSGCSASWDKLKSVLAELPRYDIVRTVESNFPEVNRAPAKSPSDPSVGGNPGYVQATSVSENDTQYIVIDSNLSKKFSILQMEENKQSKEDYSNADQLEPMTTTCIAECDIGPKSAETVLTTNDLKCDN